MIGSSFLRASTVLPILLLAAGCTSFKGAVPHPSQGISAERGKEQVAEVGGTLLLDYSYNAMDGAELVEPLKLRYGANRVEAPAGQPLRPYKIDGEDGYCTTRGAFGGLFGIGPIRACFFDRDRDGKFEALIPLTPDNWGEKDIPPQPYKLAEVIMPEKGYQTELVYRAFANNRIDIDYLEFSGDRKTRRLHQPLQFPVSPTGDVEITHRGARITGIVQLQGPATGNMRYVVHSIFAR